jgi:acyl transferase domain-containing protein
VLKPFQDALRDGDTVRAVIRHTALNQDGKTQTITSPSQEAQQELIARCYKESGLDPSQTSYVEAHGTGTRTGDPIEAAAIGIEIGQHRPADSPPLLIGSVKSNIGHCEAASGLASIVKVVKSIESGWIAPSINFEIPNPGLDLQRWNLQVYYFHPN